MAKTLYTNAGLYTDTKEYTPFGELAVVTPIDPTVTLVFRDGTTADITSYVMMASGNRSRANALSSPQAGQATMMLHNDDRRFDPGYTSGPYYSAGLGLGCEIRIDLTPSGGSAQRIFTGEVVSWDLDWIGPMVEAPTGTYRGDTSSVRITCTDRLAKLANVRSLDALCWVSDGGYGTAYWQVGAGSLLAGFQPDTALTTAIESKEFTYNYGLDPSLSGQRTGASNQPLWDQQSTANFNVVNGTPDYIDPPAENYATATVVIGNYSGYAIESDIQWTKGAGANNWPGLILGGVSAIDCLVLWVNSSGYFQLGYYGSGTGTVAGLETFTSYGTVTTGSRIAVRVVVSGRTVSVAARPNGSTEWSPVGTHQLTNAEVEYFWPDTSLGDSNYVGLFCHNATSSRYYDWKLYDAGSPPLLPRQRTLERAQALMSLVDPYTAVEVVSPDVVDVQPAGARGYASCPPMVVQGNLLTVLSELERTEYSRGFFCDRNNNIVLLARYPSAAATAQFSVDWDHTGASTASYTSLTLGLNWQRYRNGVAVTRYDPGGVLNGLPPSIGRDAAEVASRGLRELSWNQIHLDTSTDGDRPARWLAEGIVSDTATDTDDVLYPTSFTVRPGADQANVSTIQSVLSADIGDMITVSYWPVSGTAEVTQSGWVDGISWSITPKLAPTFTFALTGPYEMRSGSYAVVGTTSSSSWKAAY